MNGNERIRRTEVTPPHAEPYDEVEVAAVGAGSVGLTAAAMLAAYGIRTVVLDGADGPAGHSRAAVVHAMTLDYAWEEEHASRPEVFPQRLARGATLGLLQSERTQDLRRDQRIVS
jgi:flavin-dependent dehydrogenase